MKLWILRPIKGLGSDDNPWEPWYNKAFGFVVRADNVKDARKFANEDAGDDLGNVNYDYIFSGSKVLLNHMDRDYGIAFESIETFNPGSVGYLAHRKPTEESFEHFLNQMQRQRRQNLIGHDVPGLFIY